MMAAASHGRSSEPWNGIDIDAYADDLTALLEVLDLNKAVHVGPSTGGGEVARYIGAWARSFRSPFFAVGPKGGAPEAQVGLEAQLIRSRGRETVGASAFKHAAQASGADIASIVAAFDAATRQVLDELVAWTLKTGSTVGV